MIFRGICSWAGWHVIDSIRKAFWNCQRDKKQKERERRYCKKKKNEMESMKKMKGNFQGGFFFFFFSLTNQLLTADTDFEIIFHRQMISYISHAEINSCFTENSISKYQ